jgi:hypothetical protein
VILNRRRCPGGLPGLSCLVLLRALLAAAVLAACSPSAPKQSAARRIWQGPTDTVASQGITTHERREIAQRVSFPTCITAGAATFRLEEIQSLPTGDPVPAGLLDTGHSLDRWRLLAPAGALDEQQAVFVSVRGSTGILGRYPRLPAGSSC